MRSPSSALSTSCAGCPSARINGSASCGPEELRARLEAAGLKLTDKTGMVYDPLADEWRLGPDTDVNYFATAMPRQALIASGVIAAGADNSPEDRYPAGTTVRKASVSAADSSPVPDQTTDRIRIALIFRLLIRHLRLATRRGADEDDLGILHAILLTTS